MIIIYDILYIISDTINTYISELILPCNYVEIAGAYPATNGIYIKVENEDNLFIKDDDTKYFSYYATGRYFVVHPADVRCRKTEFSPAFIAEEDDLSSLENGEEVSFTPTFPDDREVTIACSAEAPVITTPSPTTANSCASSMVFSFVYDVNV